MITDENKKLTQWAMDYALKNGCQAANILLDSSLHTWIGLAAVKVDRLEQATTGKLSFSMYVDGRYGSISTNRLNRKELETFIKNGIESTRYLAKDEARVLADPSRYYKGGKPDLKLYDTKLASLNMDDKLAMAKAIAEEVFDKDERIIHLEFSYSEDEKFAYHLISNGFEGETKSTCCSLWADVTVKGEGEARPSADWYESSLYIDDLIKKGIGQKALERVLRKLGQKKVQSGKYTMVVDPMNSSRLLSPMMSALNGSALQQKNSFLLNKLNEKIASDRLTLTDEPHLVKASGARYFDNEGIATERRSIFDKGVLNTYFIDTYNAKKMGVDPTISGSSILVMETGDKNLDGLIAGVEKGILVTGFNGGNNNSSTGDFSYGIEGFLIENGKLTQPISEMNVTGNLITLWNSLVATGNDPRLNSSWRIPSLVFEGVDFSGL